MTDIDVEDDGTLFSRAALPPTPPAIATFDGETVEPLDAVAFGDQLFAVWRIMIDGHWHNTHDIARRLDVSSESVGARLRDLRKAKFGSYNIERRRIDGTRTFEFRLIGNRGDGDPHRRACAGCAARDAEIARLERIIAHGQA